MIFPTEGIDLLQFYVSICVISLSNNFFALHFLSLYFISILILIIIIIISIFISIREAMESSAQNEGPGSSRGSFVESNGQGTPATATSSSKKSKKVIMVPLISSFVEN